MLSDAVADCEAPSVARTVKVLDPAAVGVPEMVAAVRVSPAGKVPLAIAQVYGGTPPEASSACEYAVPTVPAGRLVVLTLKGGGAATLMDKAAVSLPPPLSVSLTVKLAFPADEGVPLITPDAAKDKPAGKLPAEMVQVTGETAPMEESVAE